MMKAIRQTLSSWIRGKVIHIGNIGHPVRPLGFYLFQPKSSHLQERSFRGQGSK